MLRFQSMIGPDKTITRRQGGLNKEEAKTMSIAGLSIGHNYLYLKDYIYTTITWKEE